MATDSDSDRIFQGESTFPGQEEWFYRAREGIAGPYLRREDAAVALRYYVKHCKECRRTGGRDVPARARAASWADLAHDACRLLEASLRRAVAGLLPAGAATSAD